jgi:hypothetical protein
MLALGLALGWWQIYRPLHARELGLGQVSVSGFLVGAAVLLSVLGAGLLAFGSAVEEAFEGLRLDRNRLNAKSVAFLAAAAAIGGAAWLWVTFALSAQGYR